MKLKDGYVITSTEKMFLNKGGSREELIQHKLNKITFLLSIIATVIAIIRFFIAIAIAIGS